MVARERDRLAAPERLADQRRRLRYARLAHRAMDLAAWRQRQAGLPPLPPGPARCPAACPWCSGRRWVA
jgi:hypothetical protein